MMRVPYVVVVAFCACAGTLLLILTAPALPPRGGAGPTDASDFAFRLHMGARLPLATRLVDENGRAVTLGDYFVKSPVILLLEYLRCTSLCGLTLQSLLEALNGLPLDAGRDYRLVTISIDPRDKPRDALAARAKYAGLLDHHGTGTGIHFLTAADPTDVQKIADAIGFPFRYDDLLDAYIHPAGFVIATPDGVIRRYVEDVAISSRQLLGAVADAEQSRAQSPLTRLLLLCKPRASSGWLTASVLTAFTVANIAAVLTLVAVFAAIWRRRA